MDQIDTCLRKASEAFEARAYTIAYMKYLEVVGLISVLLKGEFSPLRTHDKEDTVGLIEVGEMCLGKCKDLVNLIQLHDSASEEPQSVSLTNNQSPTSNMASNHNNNDIENNISQSPNAALSTTIDPGIPLIPVSPLVTSLQVTEEKLSIAQSKFEALQSQANGSDRSNQGYLSILRKALEDCQILMDRRNRISTQMADFNTTFKVVSADPKIIAQQLTLLDMVIFRKLDSGRELINCNWMKSDKRLLSPNLCSSIDFFNYVSHWVQSEILMPEIAADRAAIYQFFVRVSQHLSEHCSFNMLKALALSLKSSSILRLKATLPLIPKKIMSQLENFEAMMSDTRNYSYLRTILGRKPKPAIPFLGLFLHDLTYVEEAFQAGIGLSSPGAQKLAETLDLIGYFQQSQFPFQEEPGLQHFILTRPFKTSQELLALSKEREPPVDSSNDSPSNGARRGTRDESDINQNTSSNSANHNSNPVVNAAVVNASNANSGSSSSRRVSTSIPIRKPSIGASTSPQTATSSSPSAPSPTPPTLTTLNVGTSPVIGRSTSQDPPPYTSMANINDQQSEWESVLGSRSTATAAVSPTQNDQEEYNSLLDRFGRLRQDRN